MVPSSSACALRSPAMAAPTLYAPASPPEAAGRGRRESTGFRKTNCRASCRRSTRRFPLHRNDGHVGWVDEGNPSKKRWVSRCSTQPCIFLSVVVSYHHTKQRQLEPILKVRPCCVDQALCFTFRQQRH